MLVLCTCLERSVPRCGPTVVNCKISLASETGPHNGAKMATGWWNVLAGKYPGRLAPHLWVSSPGYCLLLTTQLHVFGNLVTSGVSILIRLLLAFPFLAWSCFWVFFKLIYREFHRKPSKLNPGKATAWNSMTYTFISWFDVYSHPDRLARDYEGMTLSGNKAEQSPPPPAFKPSSAMH